MGILDNVYFMYGAVALVGVMLIARKIVFDYHWKRYIKVAVFEIVNYGEGEKFFEVFASGWKKRGYPDLSIIIPAKYKDATEEVVEEELDKLRRGSMRSYVELTYQGDKFRIRATPRKW